MRIFSTCLVVLTVWLCGASAREALHTASVSFDEDRNLTPQENRGGWVNPEDLISMPQCIAQQDQSSWLSAMTECTSKRCTRHFGVICTHHQWLTQLSCLSATFSPDVVKGYLPYCSRSVLAKAQLYLWIRTITGRTWLVDVGDANGLQNLSPASLAEGYAAVDVAYKAPTCLTDSGSARSMEPFQHVMASCSFTSFTQHTGNAARPWEYSESLGSMIALDSETVGYNLAGGSIRYGDYFDKECLCDAFAIDPKKEPCSEPGQLDLTKERLWINATCGPRSLPDNWTDLLKTTEFAYIPIEDWYWPACIADIPRQVTGLTDQCAAEACEPDSSGYCRVKRAVDRACFCRNISYDSCGGSCHIFETRINYVNWLHNLCADVQDWHGLPDDWNQLAAPTPLDMIPWQWTVKPSNDSNTTPPSRSGSTKSTETCASNEWKLGSFALVNIATFLAVILGGETGIHRITRAFSWHQHPSRWAFTGISIAALQLFANWFNAFLVQHTLGYEDVPVIQLMLLWCSMPRLGWLTILLISVQPFDTINFSAAASTLLAEAILQVLSSYYMIMTVNYGREHNFYFGGLAKADKGTPAAFMYAGALLWLVTIGVAVAQLIRATRRIKIFTESGSSNLPKWQERPASNIAEEMMTQLNERCTLLGGNYTVYGTLPVRGQNNDVSLQAFVEPYTVTVMIMLVLWVAQWLFWSGFINLVSEEFCPPKLGILTAAWVFFSLARATVKTPW